MIEKIALVAGREYKSLTGSRAFWIVLTLLPAILLAAPLAQYLLNRPSPRILMVLARDASEANRFKRALLLSESGRILTGLAEKLRDANIAAGTNQPWGGSALVFSDASVLEFERRGGLPAALRQITIARGGRPFDFVRRPVFARIDVVTWRGKDEDARRLVGVSEAAPGGSRCARYVLVIPQTSSSGAMPAKLFARGRPSAEVSGILAAAWTSFSLTDEADGAAQAGRSHVSGGAIDLVAVGEDAGVGRYRSLVPLATSYGLLLALMLSGTWMLQSFAEERSSKLLESVLACVTPDELLLGKLMGTASVGLTIVAVWLSCAALLTRLPVSSGYDLTEMFAAYSSIGTVACTVFFFAFGYLNAALVFLAIGALSRTPRDAQSLLTPVMVLFAFPCALLPSLISNSDHPVLLKVFTWIPIYTPFVMLARVGSGISSMEVWGGALLLLVSLALGFLMLTRVFRQDALLTGERPNRRRMGREEV